MIRVRSTRRLPFAIRLLIFVIVLLVFIGELVWVMTGKIYEGLLSERITPDATFEMHLEDFDGLQRTKFEYASDQGQTLVGYLYDCVEAPRGIIVFSHDLGSGQSYYMDCADYFTRNGFCVFTFDGTGCGESEGDGLRGLRQGVIDLDYTLRFLESGSEIPQLPIGLFGHGWGGYNVCAVLDKHPEVKAVVSCSGYNNPTDFVRTLLNNAMGGWSHLIMPFFKLHDWKRFGSDARLTAMDGLDSSEAAVLIINSEDNDTVPMKYGFDIFYEEFKDDSRFVFARCKEGNHTPYLDSAYTTELREKYNSWRDALDYDSAAEENRERFEAEEAAFWEETIDRSKWSDHLNSDLMGKILSFYNENLR